MTLGFSHGPVSASIANADMGKYGYFQINFRFRLSGACFKLNYKYTQNIAIKQKKRPLSGRFSIL
jgi:hypothetical protein